jgi:hypothetical protein
LQEREQDLLYHNLDIHTDTRVALLVDRHKAAQLSFHGKVNGRILKTCDEDKELNLAGSRDFGVDPLVKPAS